MNNNFWLRLNKPPQHRSGQAIYALAPMAGFTDSAFRQICKSFGADVVYSEMASATALVYSPKKTLEMIQSGKKEAPYVIQLFGSKPEHFAKATQLLSDKKQISKFQISNFQLPQGIDINFGCPVKKVAKQGAGAVLMNNLKLAHEIIKSVISSTDLPVSIKTRSKVGQVSVLKFLNYVSDLNLSAVMIHGRTLAQGFSGPIDTEMIKKARNYFKGIILANGGVMNAKDADELLEKTEADGVGIARGALGKPWIFEFAKKHEGTTKNKKEVFKIALRHAELTYKLKGRQGIVEMRKHLCWYVQGLPGARKLRQRLVKVNNLKDTKTIFNDFKEF